MRPHDIAARKIAIVPQGRRLFPSLTVTEHLTMLKGARAKTGWTLERVFGLFPRLAERRHHRGGQLSGGERGMLAVGRALMIDPQLILMDEPSEGLAPVMVQHLEGIVRDLKAEGLSILLVEQNLYSALDVADRVYVLETGQVVHQADAAAEIGVDHVALNGAGSDDRDFDDQVVEGSRLQTRQHRHLRPALDLEDPDRVGVANHVVDGGILGGDGVELEII